MPELGFFGWIIVGLLAGALAGAFVPGASATAAWARWRSASSAG